MEQLNFTLTSYDDFDPNSYVGFPAANTDRGGHPAAVSGSGYITCDDNLNVYITLTMNVGGNFITNTKQRYDFNVWVSPNYFVVNAEMPSGNTTITPSAEYLGSSYIEGPYVSGTNKRTWCSGTFSISNAYVGKLTDFGWNESDQNNKDGIMYLAGFGYGYSVNQNQYITSIPIKIPGMQTWFNYIPSAVYHDNNWYSCNRTDGSYGGGQFSKYKNIGGWSDNLENWPDDFNKSNVFIYSDNGWNTIAPKLGERQ